MTSQRTFCCLFVGILTSGAKVCDLTDYLLWFVCGLYVVCMWFVCGNLDVFPYLYWAVPVRRVVFWPGWARVCGWFPAVLRPSGPSPRPDPS